MNPRPSPNGRAQGHRFDLNAAAAAQRETTLEPFCFEWGQTPDGPRVYTIPNAKKWPLTAQMHLEKGELTQALTVLTSAEDVAQMAADGLEMENLEPLFEAIAQHAGVVDEQGKALSPPRVPSAGMPT